MNKYLRYYLLINWLFFILIVTGFPTLPYDGTVISWHDKIFHILLFGVLAYLILYSLAPHKIAIKTSILIACFFSALASVGVEIMQRYVPGRTVSEYDFLAGLIGIIIFVLFYYVRKEKKI
ncbi:VanZ family protein [Candidatus Parcubacteria bacterium]|nr:VanZ family protein [Candidatus Parcubacteria bacterium]